MRGLCTLKEAQTYYSINDIADMVEAIELENYLQNEAMEKAGMDQSLSGGNKQVVKISGK